MKVKILAVLCTLAAAVTLSAATTAEVADAIARKDYQQTSVLLVEYLKGKPGSVVHQWLGDLLYADFMGAENQNEQTFLQVTEKRSTQYKRDLFDARRTLAIRLDRKVYYNLVFRIYNGADYVSASTAGKLADMKFHHEGDRHGAIAYAAEKGLDYKILAYVQYNTGDFTRQEMFLVYNAICRAVANPSANITAAQALEWSGKTLINLYTAGVISKDQFVTALKALQKRVYLNLGRDRKRWEPVIASIRFGIVHADKLEQLGE